jgi:hypothetical protein
VAETETTESQEDTETTTDTQDGAGNDQNTSNGDSKKPTSEVDTATEKHLGDLRKENAQWRTKLRKAETELGKLKQSKASEIETARAEARQEAVAEATAEANARIVRAEIIAAAGRKLQDPSDAVAHLDASKYEVDEKGDVDRKVIAADIDELVKSKPYLAGTRDPDFGARTPAGGGAKSMNELIKQRMRR